MNYYCAEFKGIPNNGNYQNFSTIKAEKHIVEILDSLYLEHSYAYSLPDVLVVYIRTKMGEGQLWSAINFKMFRGIPIENGVVYFDNLYRPRLPILYKGKEISVQEYFNRRYSTIDRAKVLFRKNFHFLFKKS